MAADAIPRRGFLVGVGLAGGVAAAGAAPAPPAQAQTSVPAGTASAPNREAEPLLALNEAEHAFIVAAVDTIIPADELSPSGSECGVATFIDRQLASAWGGGAKMYRSGPFLRGKPEQGYQLALTPREFFLAGIAATNEWSRKTYGKDFDRLPAVGAHRGAHGAGRRQGRSRPRVGAPVLQRAADDHHGRLLRRSDLWRQPQHGVLEDARLSGPARDLRQCHRRNIATSPTRLRRSRLLISPNSSGEPPWQHA